MAGRRRGNNEGCIYSSTDAQGRKRWRGYMTLQDGIRKHFSGKTEREVKAKIRQALRDAEEGRLVAGRAITLGRYLALWLEDIKPGTVRAHTLAGYEDRLRSVKDAIGWVQLSSLTPEHIQRCYRELAEAGLAPRTIVNTHRVLKTALHDAVRLRRLAWNPADEAWLPKIPRSGKRALTLDQAALLLQSSEGTDWGTLWYMLITTGLRIGEATGLRWRDVDFDGRRLQVCQASEPVPGGGFELRDVKTESSLRVLDLSDALCADLREHRQRQRETRLAAFEWKDLDLVFPNSTGGLMNPATARYALKRSCKAAGLPVVTPHELRHTTATVHLYDFGEQIGVVQEILGHAGPSITLGTYGHLRPSNQRQAVNRMEEALRQRMEALKASS